MCVSRARDAYRHVVNHDLDCSVRRASFALAAPGPRNFRQRCDPFNRTCCRTDTNMAVSGASFPEGGREDVRLLPDDGRVFL